MKKLKVVILFLFTQQVIFGQVSGNQAFPNGDDDNNYANPYGQNGNTSKSSNLTKLSLSDSAFIIQAKVLKNIKAGFYVAVFGLSDDAGTVAETNSMVSNRTKSFIGNIKSIGIKENDIYTDVITQYRIYDIKEANGGEVEEYLKGFELSKNVIIKYYNASQIEQLLTLASKDSIYDLIKVDYVIDDVSKVYEELFEAATEVIKKKKSLYLNFTSASVLPNAQIYGENFASYYPVEMYKSYKAYSTNFYESYWTDDKRRAMRKFKTFYYDKTDYSGFDKIISPAVLEPVVEFVLTLQVRYDLKK